MSTKLRRLYSLGLCLVAILAAATPACDSSVDPAADRARHSHESTAQVARALTVGGPPSLLSPGPLGTDAISGYRHERVHSLFAFGPGAPTPTVDGPITRHIGSEGTFVEWANGFSMARAHAFAASSAALPFSRVSAEHNARVVAYFVGLGMPTDQMGSPAIGTLMRRTGATNGTQLTETLVGYTTGIPRFIDGIPVPESHAWAQFNKNDEVVAEQVWWPALPASLHAEVATFKAMMSNSSAAAVFRAKVGASSTGDDLTMAIHHSRPSGDNWFLRVTMDFAPRGRSAVVHFDLSGTPVVLTSLLNPTYAPAPPASAAGPGTGGGGTSAAPP